ncbi:hypothetical protein IAP83_32370 [Pseudomonas aeruginosa]|uniref:hypothetical protein n=1 Tax=Pseudomonas aeruginosa TaxID=287 RepID=UPI0016579A82|nr:hypothetical protein [Pseudomonas aeruginosa]MBC9059222.1 hypothetical protein [Pseudomonas aeruginosa]MCK1085318.1 hypothetical protein [Pseudomonas aeruginosa]
MSIDWNTAPEGATHWEPTGPDFYEGWMKKEGTDWFYWSESGHKWINGILTCDVSADREATFEARPQEAWDGQGLPPVGTVCIVYPHNTQWGFNSTAGHERKVLAYHGDFVWLGTENEALEATRTDKVDFEAIHSPEQIAAEERAKAIEEMCFAVETLTVKQAKALFDAGYRRQESST